MEEIQRIRAYRTFCDHKKNRKANKVGKNYARAEDLSTETI